MFQFELLGRDQDKCEDASIIGSCIGGSEYVIGTSSREPKKTGPNVDLGHNSNDIAEEITLETPLS